MLVEPSTYLRDGFAEERRCEGLRGGAGWLLGANNGEAGLDVDGEVVGHADCFEPAGAAGDELVDDLWIAYIGD